MGLTVTRLRRLFADLITPEDFRGDGYAGVTNVTGKAALGAIVFSVLACLHNVVTGELPDKSDLLFFIICGYAVFIEWRLQRSPRRDGSIDALFFASGGGLVVVSFTELESHRWRPVMDFNVGAFLIGVVCILIAVLVYGVTRYKSDDG